MVAITVMFGTFMAVMDISVVNVAMPDMMGQFGQTLSAITWVATSYSIAEIILATMAGWWSTLLGRKRLYLISYGVFIFGSVFAGLSTSFEAMILFRVVQGIGGGALIPVSQAILRESFPEDQQGMAMAMYSMGVVLAPAVGPILGGWLTDHYGWPWIFFINVPVCVVGIVLVALFVHDPPYLKRGVRRIDWLGIALLMVTLTAMQVVLERGQDNNWFDSRWITATTALGVVALASLVWWELRSEHPIVDFRLLKNLPLSLSSLIGLVFGIGLFGTTFVLPQFTQQLMGYPAYEAGLILAPRGITLFLFLPLAGWLYKYLDPRALVLGGLAILFWSMLDLSHLSLQAGFWNMVPMLLLMGMGMPFMFVTLSTLALSTVPREKMTEATSLYTLSRRIGGNIGYALVATVVARQTQVHHAHLAAHVSDANPAYVAAHSSLVQTLIEHGINPVAAAHAAFAMIARTVDRQATMMAYNDASWLMAALFLLTIPLVLFLPGRRRRPAPSDIPGE